MLRRVKKSVRLTSVQAQRLKHLSKYTGISESEIVRRALQTYLTSHKAPDPVAWQSIVRFMQQWAEKGPVVGGRSWKREDLYDR